MAIKFGSGMHMAFWVLLLLAFSQLLTVLSELVLFRPVQIHIFERSRIRNYFRSTFT